MKVKIIGLGNPLVKAKPDGTLDVIAIVSFPNKEREDFPVSLLHPQKGYPLDDAGKVKAIAKEISSRGLDIIPNNNVQFSTFTPEETSVLEQNFNVTERKESNG